MSNASNIFLITSKARGQLSIVESKKNADSGFWNYADSFTYTAAGAVSSMQLGNGKWESTQFNSRSQPTQIALGTVQGGADKLDLAYEYGTWENGVLNAQKNNGNVAKQTINVLSQGTANGFTAVQKYEYDPLNRLISAVENIDGNQTPSWKQTFTFDRYGNRRFDEANTNTLDSNCPTAVCNPQIDPATNKLIGYQFDNSGNTKVDATNRQFIYDGENKQVEVRDAAGNPIGKYFFDGDGKRVKKISATETTIFVYNVSEQLVAEYSTQISQTPQVSYLTADHLGSPRINTDQNGNTTARHDFLPFGEEINSGTGGRTTAQGYGGQDSIRQKFTGYERDAETLLDFAQARMYNKNHGRFTSVDPLMASARISNPKTWNRYTYALNNPLRYIDPDGMDVNILDAEARRLLLLTLPEKIREKVNAAIEKGKGNLTKGSLDKIKSDDKNFDALKSMVNAKEITEAATSSTGENGVPFSQETHQQQYESDIQAYMKNNNVSREEAEKVISPPSTPNEVNFYRGQTYVPKGYVPSGEADANIPISPSGNLRAVTTDRTGAGASISEEDAVVTFGHELYGHAYYYGQGNKTWYGHGKVITDIEDRTRQNYRNTEQKKNYPVNLKPKQ